MTTYIYTHLLHIHAGDGEATSMTQETKQEYRLYAGNFLIKTTTSLDEAKEWGEYYIERTAPVEDDRESGE